MKQKYLLILILLVANKIFAQPGTLDKTFGKEGKVLCTTAEGLPYPANSVIVKKDGALLVGSGEATAFLLKQFLSDGTPDLSFGKDGELRTDFGNGIGGYITAMAATKDNDIIAAGIGEGEPGGAHSDDILLAKYLANGTLDSSFGMNGKVAADFNLIEIINCMKITSGGKILVAGYCTAGDDEKANSFLARFNSDGSVDTNFGEGGKVVTDIDHAYQSYINAIAITPDGSIIAAGNYEYIRDFQQNQILVAKYDVNGKLNTEFGNKGFVFTSVGTDADYAYAVALQNDGKIVVAGEANYRIQDSSAMAIVRYNSNGGMDQSFNKTGALSVFFGNDNSYAKALIIQPNGNYLVGGIKYPDNSSPPNDAANDFALASITKDGKLDLSFGINGIVTTDFDENQDVCYALALQQDGKIIAAGGSTDKSFEKNYISLARYDGFADRKQLLMTKIRHWLQHHNGFTWDASNNISSYVVQRSNDGVHWSAINHQQSIADSQQPAANSLYYNDPSPLSGTSYYRLQTTSTDGPVTTSNMLAVTANENAIKISPNPATNNLHIEGLSSNKVKITVVDFAGNAAFSIQPSALGNVYNLNITSLKEGNYILKIEMNDEVITKKFVKK